MSAPFIITADTPWRITGEPPLPVRSALCDLEKDWRKVFGLSPLILTEFTGESTGADLIFDWANAYTAENARPNGDEAYTLRVSDAHLIFSGSDVRGMIYAIYKFAQDTLDVDPFYLFNDFLPKEKAEISLPGDYFINSPTPCFKYRGWFINDEDILNQFFPNRTGDGVMSLEGFNQIYETLLRSGGNLIVPGSFAMPDESCRALAAARGIILNDHHVTPLGLNMYRWPDDVEFSFAANKSALEDFWRRCVDVQKDYELVWTVSFRGKNDHPFWQEDRYAPASDEERAAVINEAILMQIKIIREACPGAAVSFNMYNEQADFYRLGLISLPADIIRIWPGTGIFDENAPVRTGAGDGVYYHLTGAARNRYTEFVRPSRLFFDLGRYVSAGATSFCLFNVSNLRHLALSIRAGMDFLVRPEKYMAVTPEAAEREFLQGYAARYYGDNKKTAIANLYERFYNAANLNFVPHEASYACREHFGYATTIFEKDRPFLPDLKQNAAIQGLCRFIIGAKEQGISNELADDARDFLRLLRMPGADYAPLENDADALYPLIRERGKNMFLTQFITQIAVLGCGNRILTALFEAVLALSGGDENAAQASLLRASAEMDALLRALRRAEYGKWSSWYAGERFACAALSRDLIINARRALNGESLLPVRNIGGYRNWLYFWDKMYEYQHGCAYPLLKSR